MGKGFFESGKGLKNLCTQPKTEFSDMYLESLFFFGVDMKPSVGTSCIDLVDLTLYMPIGLEIKVKMTGTNHDELALGTCPYKDYRLTVSVVDEENNANGILHKCTKMRKGGFGSSFSFLFRDRHCKHLQIVLS